MRFQTPRELDRLLGQDLAGERDVEPPEVDELARRVDLGLIGALGLAQHRGGGQLLPPRPGQQVGGTQEHRSALVERRGFPLRLRGERGFHRLEGVGMGGVGQGAEPRGMPVRLDDVDGLAAAHSVFSADHMRKVDRLGGQRVKCGLETRAFRAAGGVVVYRFVGRHRHVSDRVHGPRMTDPTAPKVV